MYISATDPPPALIGYLDVPALYVRLKLDLLGSMIFRTDELFECIRYFYLWREPGLSSSSSGTFKSYVFDCISSFVSPSGLIS